PCIALRLPRRADAGIEVPPQESGEITGRRVTEQQLLREDAARGEDAGRNAGTVPALEGDGNVGEDLADQFAAHVAVLPDPALQLFEGWRLAIAIHQPVDVLRSRPDARGFRRIGPRRRGFVGLLVRFRAKAVDAVSGGS